MTKVLVLKTVDNEMKAYGGFIWPASGKVTCPDWNPDPICGFGLHGLLWGEGDGNLLNIIGSEDRIWLVLEVDAESVVDLEGKVKFPECEVIYAGNKDEAIEKILERNPGAACAYAQKNVGDYDIAVGDYGQAIVREGGKATAGYGGKATAGDYGQATAGYHGQVVAGDGGQATVKNYGKAMAGNYGQATAGDRGYATAGDRGKATAGDYGQATAGNFGQAMAGDYGQATAGYGGQATAGYGGQAQVGYGGQAQAGLNGIIEIGYSDGKRSRKLIGYVGEGGIKANIMYKVFNGKFERI